jgi:hypothetical protein
MFSTGCFKNAMVCNSYLELPALRATVTLDTINSYIFHWGNMLQVSQKYDKKLAAHSYGNTSVSIVVEQCQ